MSYADDDRALGCPAVVVHGGGRASRNPWWRPSPAMPSGVAASWRCAPTCGCAATTPSWGSPRSRSASSPAPVAPSGCRVWSDRPGPRSSSSRGASSRPTRHCASAWSTGSCRPRTSTPPRASWPAASSAARRSRLRAAKEAVDRGLEVDLDTGLEIERLQFSGLFATEDRAIGMTAFVEKTKPKFVGR